MPPLRLLSLVVAAAATLGLPARVGDPTRDALPPPGRPLLAAPVGSLFSDFFADTSLTGWRADRAGVWSVRRGLLRADLADARQTYSFLYAGSEQWQNYALDFDVCGMRGVDKGAVVRVVGEEGVGVDLRGPGYHDVLLHRGWVPLGKVRVSNANGVWHHVRIEARAERYLVFVDDSLLIDRRDGRNHHPRGRIALAAYTGGVGECTVYYDNVVVTRLR